jgi:predicted nucleic acid-binding protein
MTYPDTSFLCALYVAQVTSARALSFMQSQPTALISTSLLLRQSVQFQVFRNAKDATQGYPAIVAQTALSTLQANISAGVFRQGQVDWADVHKIAERLAFARTAKGGYRGFDVLHVASAIHLGVTEFLTFKGNQKKLAVAEGLRVPV